MPSESITRDTGMSRICGGSRLPASITSRMVRRPGMANRLSAYAAIEARSRLMTTAGTVTWTLIHNARPMLPSPSAVMKPSRVNDCGQAAVPLAEMSSNDRNASTITKIIGAIHTSVRGIITAWKTQPRRLRLTAGGCCAPLVAVTSAMAVAVMLCLPRACGRSCLHLVLRRAHQVRDDEDQRQREDDHRDGRGVAQVQEREALLEHVRAEQL